MVDIITTNKKRMLYWFLIGRQAYTRDVIYLLNYMIGNEMLLKNLHFIENAQNAPRGLIISSRESGLPPLMYYKGEKLSCSAEEAFHDMRYGFLDDWYIELNFKGNHTSPLYLSLLEDISFSEYEPRLSDQERQEIEQLLDFTIKERELRILEEEINKSLDNKNEKEFIKLTEKYNELLQA